MLWNVKEVVSAHRFVFTLLDQTSHKEIQTSAFGD